MLIEAIDRAEKAVEDTLSASGRVSATSSDFRRGPRRSEAVASTLDSRGTPAVASRAGTLRPSEVVASKLGALRTAAASCVAASERHGIGGVQVFADTASLTRCDARGRVRLGHRLGHPVPGIFHEISISVRKA